MVMVISFQHEYLYGFVFRPKNDITQIELAHLSKLFFQLSCFHSSACVLGPTQGVESTEGVSRKVGEFIVEHGLQRHFDVDGKTTIPKLAKLAAKCLETRAEIGN